MIYLDNSSTTKQANEVTSVMIKAMEEDFGNPSSLHDLGMNAHNLVEKSRKQISKKIPFSEKEIYFTSGGTEGNNTILKNVIEARRNRRKIITTVVEHPAILEVCKELELKKIPIHYLSVDKNCRINLEELKSVIDEETAMVSVMTVNNETGAIFPINEISKIAKEKGVWVHTDCVQGLGKFDLMSLDVDFLTASAHKIHGPKGTGILGIRKSKRIKPLIFGGGQENNFRSGTENVPGIVGMGEACRLLTPQDEDYIRSLKDYLQKGISDNIKDIIINSVEDGICSILNISFLGTRGEVILHTLESSNIYVSTGSACSSNKKGQSHVLKSMGLTEKEIEGAIRFSLSRYNTKEEIDITLDALIKGVNRFRKLGSFR